MMKNLETLVKRFVTDMESVLRQHTMAAVQTSLGKPSKVKLKTPGIPAGKRSPVELEQVKKKITDLLRKTPGQSSEQLQKVLLRSGAELQLPLKQLMDDKLLRAEGTARGRRYWLR
jgi:predicted HTH transcriptional regulator